MDYLLVAERISSVILNLTLILGAYFGWKEYDRWKKKVQDEKKFIALDKLLSDHSRINDKIVVIIDVAKTKLDFVQDKDYLNNVGYKNSSKILKSMCESFSDLVNGDQISEHMYYAHAILGEEAKVIYSRMICLDVYEVWLNANDPQAIEKTISNAVKEVSEIDIAIKNFQENFKT